MMNQKSLRRLDLSARLSGGAMPAIQIVDMGKTKNTLSGELIEEIRKTASLRRQTILFLNRRGFGYYYHCRSCGFELSCKHCSVSLTWHKSRNKAVCHYCGYEVDVPRACPKCGSVDSGWTGFGTELVEEELGRTFPDLRIRRLDADSTAKKGVLETTLSQFRAGQIDILIGTQMVAKGLNFPGLRLVGVVFADTGLQLPDFRAAERTFSLIVQVAGRAGRFLADGKVIVQTLRPADRAITAACGMDVDGFYKSEMQIRRETGFPPAARLVRMVLRGKNEEKTGRAAAILGGCVKKHLPADADMLGPCECPLSKIAGNFRRHIIMRGRDMGTLHAAARLALDEYRPQAEKQVYMEADVDPVSLL
jgi:primosomal protein N' (replication factor Y)